MDGDARIPAIDFQRFGYLYLSDNEAFSQALVAARDIQIATGARTEILTADNIAARYPFYNLDGIECGSINMQDEGYWDGGTVFEWLRRKAQERGITYLAGEVRAIERRGARVVSVTLADGQRISCGRIVNAAGPRASQIAEMAGLFLPVEPRKRFSWVFRSKTPVGRMPLTIDPSGIHFRPDGPETYLAGCAPVPDGPVDPDDFAMDHDIFENHVWPILATRVPAFERLRIVNEWAGHYAYNRLDQNAVVGPHPEVENFLFLNGFSGHGLQQALGLGRGIAECLTFGDYRSLDLRPFGYDRIGTRTPMVEKAII